MSVSGLSIASARTRAGGSKPMVVSAIAQLRDDPGNVVRRDRLAVAIVDGDDRRRRAAAEALDGPQGHGPLGSRLTGPHPQLALERPQPSPRVDEAATDVLAHP